MRAVCLLLLAAAVAPVSGQLVGDTYYGLHGQHSLRAGAALAPSKHGYVWDRKIPTVYYTAGSAPGLGWNYNRDMIQRGVLVHIPDGDDDAAPCVLSLDAWFDNQGISGWFQVYRFHTTRYDWQVYPSGTWYGRPGKTRHFMHPHKINFVSRQWRVTFHQDCGTNNPNEVRVAVSEIMFLY